MKGKRSETARLFWSFVILGKYLLQEKWDFSDKIITGQTNLFGDEVLLAVPENIFDKAKRALAVIDKYEVLTDAEAEVS